MSGHKGRPQAQVKALPPGVSYEPPPSAQGSPAGQLDPRGFPADLGDQPVCPLEGVLTLGLCPLRLSLVFMCLYNCFY